MCPPLNHLPERLVKPPLATAMPTLLVPLDNPAQRENLALMALQVNREQVVILAYLETMHLSHYLGMDNAAGVRTDHPVNLAHLDHLELLDLKEALVLPAVLAIMAVLAHLDRPVLLEMVEMLVLLDLVATKVRMQSQAAKESQVPLEAKETPEPVAQPEIAVLLENPVALDPVDHKDRLALAARQEAEDKMARPVALEPKARMLAIVLALVVPRKRKQPLATLHTVNDRLWHWNDKLLSDFFAYTVVPVCFKRSVFSIFLEFS